MKNKKIQALISELKEEIKAINNIDEKIEVINYCRIELSEVSPFKNHPVDCVIWEKSDKVEANEYNPNKVAPPEMKLLERSILEDGYTMPIYTNPEEGVSKIIDGFHRRTIERANKQISNSTFGRVPITIARAEKRDVNNRQASTIRHNRARGTHDLRLMQEIVRELKESGMSDAWIMKHIGMDADELLRLKQINGLAALHQDDDFSFLEDEILN